MGSSNNDQKNYHRQQDSSGTPKTYAGAVLTMKQDAHQNRSGTVIDRPAWSQKQRQQQQQQQRWGKPQCRSPPNQGSKSPAGGSAKSASPPPVMLASGRLHEPPRPEDLPTPPQDWLLSVILSDDEEANKKSPADSCNPASTCGETPSIQWHKKATMDLKKLLHLQS